MTHLYRKSDPDDKTNYQPISVLPSLSKVYEKILCKQFNSFFETKLYPHSTGFGSRYNVQHALSNLLFDWQNCLDISGVVGTILTDLSKAFHRLPHDLIIGTLRPEYENNEVNGRETETSFLVAVFRLWRQNITKLWREPDNDSCKEISKCKN